MKPLSFLPELLLRSPFYTYAEHTTDRLQQVLGETDFQNALYLASPQFYQSLAAHQFEYGALPPKQQFTLQKYFNRMCFRPTPFGMFASFSLLRWDEGEPIILGGREAMQVHLFPDQQIRVTAHDAAGCDPQEMLRRNPFSYALSRHLRFLRSVADAFGQYRFTLEAVPFDRFYRQLLALLTKGPIRAAQLADWILYRTQCTAAEAWDYVCYLVEIQLLWRSGQPVLILQQDHLTALSTYIIETDFWRRWQGKLLSQSGSIPAAGVNLASLWHTLPMKPGQQPFYSALERQACGSLSLQDQAALLSAVGALQKLTTAPALTALEQFKQQFEQRFDRKKVPVLLALDPDAGIPYGELQFGSGMEDIEAPVNATDVPKDGASLHWTQVHRLLLELWTHQQRTEAFAPIVIDDQALAGLGEQDGKFPLPPSLPILFSKSGDQLIVDQAGGPSATTLVGRFSLFSEEVTQLCRRLAAAEQEANPDVIFADLSQFTHTHVDNINRRRQLYEYTIPINIMADQEETQLILPEDLLLSVQNGELVLESVRLQKRVIPRLATAFNYAKNGLPLFRLLCDLQHQGLHTTLHLEMEEHFPGLKFYPRVAYQQQVLALAQWIFSAGEVRTLTLAPAGQVLEAVQKFRAQHHLPAWISMGEGDQQLVFHLQDAAGAAFWCRCLKGLHSVRVKEYLVPDGVHNAAGEAMSAQFLAFLINPNLVFSGLTTGNHATSKFAERKFWLGSSWLYLKLFSTPETARQLLLDVIYPVLRQHRQHIRRWFFVRYTEGGYHIRLRVLAEEKSIGGVLIAINTRLQVGCYDQLVREYQAGAYERELERYHPQFIEQAEELFHYGSELALWLLSQGEQLGWSALDAGLLLTQSLTTTSLDKTSDQHSFYQQRSAAFLSEMNEGKPLEIRLNQFYREQRQHVESLLREKPLPKAFLRLLNKQAVVLSRVHQMTCSWTAVQQMEWIGDVIHMQLNRLFPTEQRRQEMRVYYLLYKFTGSKMARRRDVY